MKRIAESPAQSERSKDQRFRSPMSTMSATLTTSATSPASAMSYIGALKSRRPQPLQGVVVPDEGHTAQTEGAMRNNFVVDVLKKNGDDFKGTIKHQDAIKLIFVSALGFKPQEFAGAIPGYRGNPTVLFKTKEIFNIDERFANLTRFSFVKRVKEDSGERTDTYDCSIRGVREKDGQRNDPYTWIKVEGADYQLEASTIKKWLAQYGNAMSDLTEDKADLELSSEEEEMYQGVELTTGTYSVKMLLRRPIPQFLPMDGKKIRIFHKGIAKLCSRCYRKGHLRSDCPNKSDDWLTYVDRYMINEDLDETFYGKWVNRIAEWRLINPDIHQANLEEAEAYWQNERRKREQQRGEINDLVQHLEANSQAQLPQGGVQTVNHVRPQDESEKDQQQSDEQSEESMALENGASAAIAARKERKATSTKVGENEDIESGMSGMSFAGSEGKKKRRGRSTATAAETATARTSGEEAKMKTRSTSLEKRST